MISYGLSSLSCFGCGEIAVLRRICHSIYSSRYNYLVYSSFLYSLYFISGEARFVEWLSQGRMMNFSKSQTDLGDQRLMSCFSLLSSFYRVLWVHMTLKHIFMKYIGFPIFNIFDFYQKWIRRTHSGWMIYFCYVSLLCYNFSFFIYF